MADGSQLKQQVITLPSGATAGRPGSPVTGDTRWNTTLGGLEIYNGSSWSTIGVKDGSSMSNAAASAVDLYNLGIRGKSLYWITRADGVPIQVYCDLDTLSAEDSKAGWMLVASWGTASNWTNTSSSSSTVFGSTALNGWSSNFGNTTMTQFRVKVSSAVDTASGSTEADWYYYWNSGIMWKQVWSWADGNYNYMNDGSGDNNGNANASYHSGWPSPVNNGAATPRCCMRGFNGVYNLKYGYRNTNQRWNNFSDGGGSGTAQINCNFWSGLTTSGVSLNYNFNGDGTLGIIPSGDTSTTCAHDCNTNNAKYGYDDTGLAAFASTSATNNIATQTGTLGSNTNMWMWIK